MLDLIISTLKLLPLSLALLLSIFSLKFIDRWVSFTKKYQSEEVDPHYMNKTAYIFDKLQVKYSLSTSFFYVGVVIFITIIQNIPQTPDLAIVILLMVFFALSALSCSLVELWFNPEQGRDADSYYQYYYERDQLGPDLEDNFCHRLLPVKWDQKMSPKRATVLVEFLLIIYIFSYNFLRSKHTSLVLFAITGLIILVGILIFPGKILYPFIGNGIDTEKYRIESNSSPEED